ncbi:MAG: hypothetical protein CL840_08760 [Crocinitomicaceae bacterium]|nr:hypothetical protein [Crocinitomicaceae bacterium]|tara:strand:+ start:49381 stop:49986 length:606 start_codon:yes stop_codon:yes gene_type:complete
MKRIVVIILAVASFSFIGKAQGSSDLQLSMNYNIGIPMGDFTDYINQASFRGMNLQVDYYLSDKLAIGASIGWNGFYQKKARESYEFGGGAINAVRYNYLYQLPLYLKVQYIISDEGNIMPYVALAAGGHYIEHETYLGYVGFADDSWSFGTAPELGALMMLGQSGWHFKLSAQYHLTFYNRNNIGTIQNLGINMGFNYDF